MKSLILTFLTTFAILALQGQEATWVFFSNKGPEVSCLLENPETYLTPDAIQRRAKNGLSFTATDLPVYAPYISEVKHYANEYLGASRWLNAVAVSLTPEMKEEIENLDFVVKIRKVASGKVMAVDATENDRRDFQPEEANPISNLNYGQAELQNTMLEIEGLHQKGFMGEGVKIAIMDAGFRGVDKIDAFDSIRMGGRILATYDFVKNDTFVYDYDVHGTQVMSIIGANIKDKLVGTAPKASFMLFRTENRFSETRQEEYNWVKAMEMADSLGADVIHTSLGYSTFDTKAESYDYKDMDGNTSITTMAADMAARKGIIVTASAGNERLNSWGKIVAPCDGDSVLCIGSIDRYQKLSSFSSIGPSADGRIKPDVVAMGSRTKASSYNNRIYGVSGTSFSAPLIAGVVSCLREAHPDRSNMDIIEAIRLSGDQYVFPDEKYGYGIPSAVFADSLLKNVEDLSAVKIVMDEKPFRGRKPQIVEVKPKPKIQPIKDGQIVFTLNPKTEINIESKKINVSTQKSEAAIQSYILHKGKQKVLINEDQVSQSNNELSIKTKYLIKGEDYYLEIITDQFEEKIPFILN